MVEIFNCGDIVNTNSENTSLVSNELKEIISKADFAICNFEAPICDDGFGIAKCGPVLRQSSNLVTKLKAIGFDMFLLANNHIMDYGYDGLANTISLIEDEGLYHVGAGSNFNKIYEPRILEIKGLKIGVINCCEAQFGVHDFYAKFEDSGYAWVNHPKIDKNIIELKKQCDFIIVYVHAGLENEYVPQIEWRYRYRHLCDLGADAIIASHPHVPQGYEKYGNSCIFYSLGNFFFDWGSGSKPSFSVVLKLTKNQPIDFKLVYHKMEKGETVLADEEVVDIDKLNLLIEKDCNDSDYKVANKHELRVRKTIINSLSNIPNSNTVIGILKEVVASIIGRRRGINKNIIGLHFLRNESYHNVIKCSLYEKGIKK
ncbi:CapA family protein [Pseudoalteromonas gelatinilytica]|uniref:CapA family protein n=1 Tax=Pseudoalteromonas gelatinilytica TaxID=1703256 RepID=A0A3A3ENP7_9GAMM|nr:CapA family protein [Pseudoalteromonas profundi]RJF38000.1 CapA family protein [Pseudoalteromonas profundi]